MIVLSQPTYSFSFCHHRASLVAQVVNPSACNAGDPGSIPGWGRSPGEGNGNLLQYPCLKNFMDGGAWQSIVHGVTESDTTEWLMLCIADVIIADAQISDPGELQSWAKPQGVPALQYSDLKVKFQPFCPWMLPVSIVKLSTHPRRCTIV